MKKSTIIIFLMLAMLKIQAQNYLISFTGTGATTSVGSVKVDNMTSGATVTLNGTDILHLKGSLGIETQDINNNILHIYPNPMAEQSILTFVAPESGAAFICIVDLSGRTVYQISTMLSTGQHSFRISGISQGMYFLKVSGNNYNYSTKLINQGSLHDETRIEHVSSVKNIISIPSKSSETTIEMKYTEGDILMYKGISGQYSTIVTDVPVSNKTITFNFVACTDNDGNHYTTVYIGTLKSGGQTWMAENLNVGVRIDGNQEQTNNSIIEKYCYNNDVNNCYTYGGLYQWEEMMQMWYLTTEAVQGICPAGWHIPTDGEWTILSDFLGGESVAGGKMKETGTNHWNSPNYGATNVSGFTALPGGYGNGFGFTAISRDGFFHSSSQYTSKAWYRVIVNNLTDLARFNGEKSNSKSVRCIQGNGIVPPPCPNVTYEGKTYNTVLIGTQCWFKENLNVGTRINGSQIQDPANGIKEKYCYNDLESNCDIYGGLYQWNELMQGSITPGSQGICPQGWHLPNNAEWTTLTTYLGGESIAGGKMKESGSIHWSRPGGSNISGFTALPGGHSIGGTGIIFSDLTYSAYFWSSSQYDATGAWDRYLHSTYDDVIPGYSSNSYGLSARCVLNQGSGTVPTVSTNSVTNPTQTTATCGGNVTNDGGATVTGRGVCWSTSSNPTISNSHTTDGSGTGSFTSNITGLTANTPYYVRAYATNNIGTAYGNQVSFSTTNSGTVPTVSTNSITNITETSAIGGGNVTAQGSSSVISRGVCWSTSSNPTTSDSHTTDGGGTGSFTSNITGLTENAPYYVRAYATNNVGTAYGNQVSFTTTGSQPCPGTPTVIYEGKTYNTVQIGTQCWLKENLNVGTRIDGSQIQDPTNGIKEKYCYDNQESNCDIYGGLYQWNEMMQGSTTPGAQGICPSGWHIPTDAEWTILTTYLGGEGIAGGKMKSTGTIEAGTGLWYSPNTGATNESGFTGVPAGTNHIFTFSYVGSFGHLCCSSEYNSDLAWYRRLRYGGSNVNRDVIYKSDGSSVRCLRDQGSGTVPTVSTNSITNITETSAIGGGNVTAQGSSSVTIRGVCWSTSSNPTTADAYTTDGSGTGNYTSNMTGLTANTPYYVRAYATNNVGTAYGNQVSFTTTGSSGGQPCPGTPTVTYEGKTYNTVQIGIQCWLKENLNVGIRINGSQIQDPTNGIKEKYCNSNQESSCDIYGGLYQWDEMMQGSTTPGAQGICPSGWHLPSDAEWTALTDFLGGESIAGGKMKEAGTAHWSSPNTGATNSSGFTALPGGSRVLSGNFSYLTLYGNFWSSMENSPSNAWLWGLQYDNEYVFNNNVNKATGFSARCVKN